MIPILHQTPEFGVNYAPGWIGFVRSAGPISDAIACGERFVRGEGWPEVTHALVAVGDGECIEALMDAGVSRSPLGKYFADPSAKIYFRRPVGLVDEDVAHIVGTAILELGKRYAPELILEEAAADTYLGHIVNALTHDAVHEELAKLIGRGGFICSMLVAYCLASAPAYRGLDILARPKASIDPQTLFQSTIFEPIIYDCSREENR